MEGVLYGRVGTGPGQFGASSNDISNDSIAGSGNTQL